MEKHREWWLCEAEDGGFDALNGSFDLCLYLFTQFLGLTDELALGHVDVDVELLLLGEGNGFPHFCLWRELLGQFAFLAFALLDATEGIDLVPCELAKLGGDGRMDVELTAFVMDLGVWHIVPDGDLSYSWDACYGHHEVVASGEERAVLGVLAVLQLSLGWQPRVVASVHEATVAEVLPEVVRGNHSNLAWETVVNLSDDVIFRLENGFGEFFCVHREDFCLFAWWK